MRHATRQLVLAGALAISLTAIAPTVLAEMPAASAPLQGSPPDAAQDDAGATPTRTKSADPGGSVRPCFPVQLPVWGGGFHGADYVRGWASVDQTAHFAGSSCEVKGWVADSCARSIPVYLAHCPEGAFTFTRTEADCYSVLGCRDPHATAGYGGAR